ncbi:hypothetical protein [Roseomonas sp. HF4]|uniref:hypothetical protein n=1 Tax=Roseomonas sp. HF4 TaxID=2562313 RepID=UPI0010C0CC66|nr:hypothetical protein [Roseomonas sp. HF4]
MSTAAFDPWAALAEIRKQAKARADPKAPPDPAPAGRARLGRLDGLGGGHLAPAVSAPRADAWLADIALSIGRAVAAGAEREADAEGWLLLIRPEGDRLVVAPHIVAELDGAGLLPRLPAAVERSTYAARARPPEWWNRDDEPQAGDRCRCGGRSFWTERDRPGGWRCSTCHPPLHLGIDHVLVVTTERTEP